MSAVDQFVFNVAALSFTNAFNPYRDTCEIFDFPEAPHIRQELLRSTLVSAVEAGVDSLWIGRDLGYRGGRRTGLALTDEAHVMSHLRRWGITKIGRVVKGQPQSERTATVVWRMLDQISERVYLWNVFPLHPHEPENPFSNRAHTAAEREGGEVILSALVRLLHPRTVVAIGQDAARSAARCCSSEVVSVRHPSYGGVRDFEGAISKQFRIDVDQSSICTTARSAASNPITPVSGGRDQSASTRHLAT